jgi:hypothetical protein
MRQDDHQMAFDRVRLLVPQRFNLLRQVVDIQGGPILGSQVRGLRQSPGVEIGVIIRHGHEL